MAINVQQNTVDYWRGLVIQLSISTVLDGARMTVP